MTDKLKPLSKTARAVLTLAATRNDHLVPLPRLPAAAARQVGRSLLNAGLAEQVPALFEDAAYAWRTCEDVGVLMLRATAHGLARLAEGRGLPTETEVENAEPSAGTVAVQSGTGSACSLSLPELSESTGGTAQGPQQRPDNTVHGEAGPVPGQVATVTRMTMAEAPRAVGRDTLSHAAEALLTAWAKCSATDEDIVETMDKPFADLRGALSTKRSGFAPTHASRTSKDTKHLQVLAMLRRDEGASGPQIAEAMGWAPHTVRGFLAGLAKKGIVVDVLERVRQVGPKKQGAKGSYSVYRLAGNNAR